MAQPTNDLIIQFKEQYGDVYSLEYGDITFVFRALTFDEYDRLSLHEDEWSSAEVEEALAKHALLYPEDVDFDVFPAGLASAIAENVYSVSGFANPQMLISIMEEKRGEALEARSLMKAFVIAAMPYKEEELDHLTFSDLAHKVAMAEQIIQIQQGIIHSTTPITLDLEDPEEAAEKEQKLRKRHNAMRDPGKATYDDPIAQRLKQAMGG